MNAPKATSFTSIFYPGGDKEIGDIYRDRFGGPPFPITRNKPRKPLQSCTQPACYALFDPNEGRGLQGCTGSCKK